MIAVCHLLESVDVAAPSLHRADFFLSRLDCSLQVAGIYSLCFAAATVCGVAAVYLCVKSFNLGIEAVGYVLEVGVDCVEKSSEFVSSDELLALEGSVWISSDDAFFFESVDGFERPVGVLDIREIVSLSKSWGYHSCSENCRDS